MKQIIVTLIFILAFGAISFAQTNENPCPQIRVIGPRGVINLGESAQLNVEANKEIEKYKIEYFWTVSGGKIVRGQGTPEIEVATGLEDEGSNIEGTVKLKGLPENCPDSGSEFIVVRQRDIHRWFDMFGKLANNELYGRLDNYFVALINDPTSEGLIVLEFDKNETKAKKIKRLNDISKHLKIRRFDRTRLSFLIAEVDEEYTRLYILPPTAKFTEVISESDLPNIIKGEELDRKIKELFPKK